MNNIDEILEKYYDATIRAEPLVRLLINYYSNDTDNVSKAINMVITDILESNEMYDVLAYINEFFWVLK